MIRRPAYRTPARCAAFLFACIWCLQTPSDAAKLKFEHAFDIGGDPSFAITQDSDGFLWFGSFSRAWFAMTAPASNSSRKDPVARIHTYPHPSPLFLRTVDS
ncbi:uncharacterized protein METZ01_LOCUS340483 [marine metagenome]|uniref:Uncharacterized protein n=1 Tax=marine metagenome TaxID=408172 RepID=A0A382QQ31_9ZZZZ